MAQRWSSDICTLSLTSALDGVGWSTQAPAALPPGKTRYPLYRRLDVPQGRSGRVRKISPPPWFDPWTVQPVTSRYTDWAVPAHISLSVSEALHGTVGRFKNDESARIWKRACGMIIVLAQHAVCLQVLRVTCVRDEFEPGTPRMQV